MRFLTICFLFQVLKRLEEEEGGGHMVTDFVTRLMRPKNHTVICMYIYIYIYICVCVCLCKCMCLCMCVYVYVLYNYMHYIFFPSSFFCVYI